MFRGWGSFHRLFCKWRTRGISQVRNSKKNDHKVDGNGPPRVPMFIVLPFSSVDIIIHKIKRDSVPNISRRSNLRI